jgi:hypothetical protein
MTFGYIDCDEHGEHQRTWFVCSHIKTLGDVVVIDPWSEKEGGSLCCAIPTKEHSDNDVFAICEEHVKERGLLPLIH